MAIETTCGGCGKLLAVGDEYAGRRARCPECGQIYTVPTPTGPSTIKPSSTPDSTHYFSEGSAGSGAGVSADGLGSAPDRPSGELAAMPPTPPPLGQTPLGQSPQQPVLDQFWMRTPSGNEYGPADRVTLDRWFREGRVGPGYMIRQSETGIWQPAETYRSQVQPFAGAMPQSNSFGASSGSGNPYAASATAVTTTGVRYPTYPKPDQSGLVLAFGILSWFVCPIFGVVAWVMGRTALQDIAAGMMDPANKGLLQVGYYLGMVNVILYTLCFGGYVVVAALAITLG